MSQEFVCSIDATVPAPTAEAQVKLEVAASVDASVDLAPATPAGLRWNESNWDEATWGV